MKKPDFIPLTQYHEYSQQEMIARSAEFYVQAQKRRTVRNFSKRQVPREVIENCIRTAGTAPNGANKQPWHFAVVSNPNIKKKIRLAAEQEEEAFYSGRAPDDWLKSLEQFGTDQHKPFLETASHLIVIFAQSHALNTEGQKVKNYYVQESVGIASGLLIAALHHAGLVSLTHTPSPMKFLNEILNRPLNERPYLILVVGYPEEGAKVPNINKKTLVEIATFIE